MGWSSDCIVLPILLDASPLHITTNQTKADDMVNIPQELVVYTYNTTYLVEIT